MDLLKRATTIAVVLLTGAIVIAASPACGGPKCSSTDLECFLDNLVLMQPENEGKRMNLTSLQGSKLPPRSARSDGGTSADGGSSMPVPSPCGEGRFQCNGACISVTSDPNNCGGCGAKCPDEQPCKDGQCGGCPPGDAWCPGTGCTFTGGDEKNCGGCGKTCDPRQICDSGICQCRGDNPSCMAGTPPSITENPDSVRIPEPQTLEPLNLGFDDPNECSPAFCARLCRGTSCTARSVCVPPVRDGKVQGVWRSYLGFLTEAASDATFTMGITPISAPGCPEDLIDQLNNGAITADIGVEIDIDVKIEGTGVSSSSSSSSSSSGSSGGSSSGVVSPGAQCSPWVPNCTCQIRSCSNGRNCWYETSRGRVSCAGCSCNAAAQKVVSACCPKP